MLPINWIVEFGQILEETLNSQVVQRAFNSLTKASANDNSGNLIRFNLENYKFEHHYATINLHIELIRNNKIILSKLYSAEGTSQGAKMALGGSFAMRNATQQSTKVALDNILHNFLADVRTKS